MLGIITLVILVVVVGSVMTGINLTFLALALPIGLFAFVIYKFKREGVVSILFFIGGCIILTSLLLFTESLRTKLITILVGLVLSVVAFLLAKICGVRLKNRD